MYYAHKLDLIFCVGEPKFVEYTMYKINLEEFEDRIKNHFVIKYTSA